MLNMERAPFKLGLVYQCMRKDINKQGSEMSLNKKPNLTWFDLHIYKHTRKGKEGRKMPGKKSKLNVRRFKEVHRTTLHSIVAPLQQCSNILQHTKTLAVALWTCVAYAFSLLQRNNLHARMASLIASSIKGTLRSDLLYLCICIHVYACIMCSCACVCMLAYVCVCVHMHVHISVSACAYFVCAPLRVCVCVIARECIHTYIYIYVCMYPCVWLSP